MTEQVDIDSLTDADRAIFALEGKCTGCGAENHSGIFAHRDKCPKSIVVYWRANAPTKPLKPKSVIDDIKDLLDYWFSKNGKA